ncbi:xaa-Pro aminopeptidase 3 [Onthophagus taurus]|uniref:xaa-Pro aminopeptidase 3 n=1 Tax=Onthophagus taurus TaxID=166361 RepID=UPI000C202163|nr:probable Xaa-Pro aminopeptidase 3 [Onthophagus taurus]
MFANVSARSVQRIYCFRKDYCTFKRSQMSKREGSSTIKKSFGQPTVDTHPFLIGQGEVTPGIQMTEFQDRRRKLMETILQYTEDSRKTSDRHIVIIPSAVKQYMSDKIPYVFRQNTDFLYLTGCLEPDSCLVLTSAQNSKFTSTLFVRTKDNHSEVWDGPRTGPEEAVNLFGVDQALPTTELENFVGCSMKSNKSVMVWYDVVNVVQPSVHKILTSNYRGNVNKIWEAPKEFLHKLRLIKSPAEIQLMRKSCEIASRGISETISASKPGSTEHDLYASVDYHCRINGAEYLAYPPVVAGGSRATIIHYINNNQVLNHQDLVLMDAGCEYHGYASDITRTWPVGGAFTNAQKILYEIVLDVQTELIELCYRFPTLDKLFDIMCSLLGRKLSLAGLIPQNSSNYELSRIAFQFCPHHVSHYLGMDVHDTPSIPRSIKIEPGMVVTVEPGIYIPEQAKVPDEFKGIGIRIEDDVLITENGPEILSKNCPKSLTDITLLAAQNQR